MTGSPSRCRAGNGSAGVSRVRAERLATTSQDECLSWLQAAGLAVTHNQVARGPYRAEFALVTLSYRLRFSHSRYGAAIATRGAPPAGTWTFSLLDPGPGAMHFNQQSLAEGRIAVLRPGEEFLASRPPGLRSLVVYAAADLVERRCATLHGVTASAFFRGGAIARADKAAVAASTRRYARIAAQAMAGGLQADDAALAPLCERLVDGVLAAIAPPERPCGWSNRRVVLDRAWEAVEADHEIASVGQLCARLGVPIRTLDDAFQLGMGLAPKRFIMAVRLNRVRRLLSRPDAGTTVTGAATGSSFFHFGHFAHGYRELFGETPSQTLRRARDGMRPAPRDDVPGPRRDGTWRAASPVAP